MLFIFLKAKITLDFLSKDTLSIHRSESIWTHFCPTPNLLLLTTEGPRITSHSTSFCYDIDEKKNDPGQGPLPLWSSHILPIFVRFLHILLFPPPSQRCTHGMNRCVYTGPVWASCGSVGVRPAKKVRFAQGGSFLGPWAAWTCAGSGHPWPWGRKSSLEN